MFETVLSVLLMGMLSVVRMSSLDQETLHALPLAPPTLAQDMPLQTERMLNNRVTASGVLILDVSTGQEVFSRGSDKRRPIGSLTKLMTALVIIEHHDLTEWVTVPQNISTVEGQTIHLPPGSEFTVGDLLTALLVASANDAAETLARYHSGSDAAFVREMNNRAHELGLKDTSYINPSGLDGRGEWSTPHDTALLANFDLRFPEIRGRLSLKSASINSRDTKTTLSFSHTHTLLHTEPAIIAGKTGTTINAGQCLLSLVQEGGREYLVVLLGSRERYGDMKIVLSALASLLV